LDHLDIIEKELYGAGLRLNQKEPDVVVSKKNQGGISVHSTTTLDKLSKNQIKSIASEFLINADITIRENINEDQLIDYFSQNRAYISAMVALNKIDLVNSESLKNSVFELQKKWNHINTISAEKNEGLKKLKEEIFNYLKLIRVYMKPVGKKIDFDDPLILRERDTVEDACKKLHRDFKRKFRYASVSGPSAKHDIQKVGLRHVLKDEDILTIVIWKQ
jgi:ribosome-interacting GTPase 1